MAADIVSCFKNIIVGTNMFDGALILVLGRIFFENVRKLVGLKVAMNESSTFLLLATE